MSASDSRFESPQDFSKDDPCWQRLQGYFDAWPEFVPRLMDKQGWTQSFARQALIEYLRYCWLSVHSESALSPSDTVDQVWHQHLQYTRDYWQRFCPQFLGRPLHHEPGEPGRPAGERYRAQYAETLASYQRCFGLPPAVFWPAAGRGPRYRIVEVQQRLPGRWRAAVAPSALTVAVVAAPSAMAGALGPLDWSGSAFLGLFLPLVAIAIFAAQLLRWLLRRSDGAANPVNLTALELAYLAGGRSRMMDAAIAELLASGIVSWDAAVGLKVGADPAGLTPELRAVANMIRLEPKPARLARKLGPALRPVQASLERRGLILGAAAIWRRQWLSAAIPAALCAYGIAKIAIGMSRHKPVDILVVLCIVLAVYALVLLFRRPLRSWNGDAALQQARRTHTAAMRVPRASDLGLAVALLGTGAMAGSTYAAYHEARRSPDSGDGGSSSCSSGGGDGGGSGGCGGCGGGGD
ncbi:MAG: hypothetical protein JWQ90_2788 [Hydrocarboniphaga sp.]|uniref:TIGR04222 domain-containing membrane protein n=1 Tax=Hydrocarboniphaga sp. TaxID=2033016 RepID=UPI00262C8CC9|nr:TIGR04222 domain-containing membrane protein [Hydrocarboniphaga sp.]MDB5970338.1 hypothetical protein [Hydrocarboniphaga sp.]